MRELLRQLLPMHGWTVSTAGDGLTALQLLETQAFAAVIADLRIAGPNGIRVLEHARLMLPDARLVLLSGYVGAEWRERAQAIGAACVTKGSTDSVALLLTVLEES